MEIASTAIQAGAIITGIGRLAVRDDVATSRALLAGTMGFISEKYTCKKT